MEVHLLGCREGLGRQAVAGGVHPEAAGVAPHHVPVRGEPHLQVGDTLEWAEVSVLVKAAEWKVFHHTIIWLSW